MANPVFVNTPAAEWTKVADNVTSAIVHNKKLASSYVYTYRMHGGTAPTDITEGVPAFDEGNQEKITASAAIDVYFAAIDKDGRVRVDIY
jgi:hypothetical protein